MRHIEHGFQKPKAQGTAKYEEKVPTRITFLLLIQPSDPEKIPFPFPHLYIYPS